MLCEVLKRAGGTHVPPHPPGEGLLKHILVQVGVRVGVRAGVLAGSRWSSRSAGYEETGGCGKPP